MRCSASARVANQCASRHSARSVPLNDSTCALSVGLPGREKSIGTPARYAHKSIAWLVNSDPLSQNSIFGTARCEQIQLSTRTTSSPFKLCPSSMARLSRVNTSTTVKARNLRPSASSTPDSVRWPWRARDDSWPRTSVVAACSAASGPLLDTADTPVSCPPSSPPASAAPGSFDIHNAHGPWQSLNLSNPQTQRGLRLALALVPIRRDGHSHHPGKHDAGSPGRCRPDSPPPGDDARALELFCQHILQHGLVQANSATSFFNRMFSSCSCYSCRTWSISRPTYCFFQR